MSKDTSMDSVTNNVSIKKNEDLNLLLKPVDFSPNRRIKTLMTLISYLNDSIITSKKDAKTKLNNDAPIIRNLTALLFETNHFIDDINKAINNKIDINNDGNYTILLARYEYFLRRFNAQFPSDNSLKDSSIQDNSTPESIDDIKNSIFNLLEEVKTEYEQSHNANGNDDFTIKLGGILGKLLKCKNNIDQYTPNDLKKTLETCDKEYHDMLPHPPVLMNPENILNDLYNLNEEVNNELHSDNHPSIDMINNLSMEVQNFIFSYYQHCDNKTTTEFLKNRYDYFAKTFNILRKKTLSEKENSILNNIGDTPTNDNEKKGELDPTQKTPSKNPEPVICSVADSTPVSNAKSADNHLIKNTNDLPKLLPTNGESIFDRVNGPMNKSTPSTDHDDKKNKCNLDPSVYADKAVTDINGIKQSNQGISNSPTNQGSPDKTAKSPASTQHETPPFYLSTIYTGFRRSYNSNNKNNRPKVQWWKKMFSCIPCIPKQKNSRHV